MGRLINEETLIKKNVENYVDRTASEYSRYLETTPVFVTYYQRNAVGSSYDKGLENVEKDIGINSPNKFNKIEKFPMYGIDGLTTNISREDYGLNTEYEGDATILPNSLRPHPEDFFTIDYIGEIYLFKITNVSTDAIKQKPYYKVTFNFFKKIDDVADLEQHIDGTFMFMFDNIGTENRPVMEKTDFLTIDFIDKIYEQLCNSFVKYFYSQNLNVIRFRIGEYDLYDRHLTKFMMDNELFKTGREYLNTIHLVDFMKESIGFYEMHKCTLYYALMKQNTESLCGEYIFPVEINDVHTPFAQHSFKFHTVNYVAEPYNGTLELYPESLIGRIKIDQPYRDDNHFIENFIIDYVHKRLKVDDKFLETLNKEVFYPDSYSFAMLPIIMFILKDSKNKLIRTT